MRAYEPKGAVGEADAVPENPLAQNAATEALKPKARAVPAVGATLDDPNAPALPGVQPSTSAPMVNIDPNAYAPPPQAAEPAVTAPTPLPTLSGNWQAPTAAPGSAPLIASAAGGTMTPQGDVGNAFRGYQTDQGGTFGQADTGDRSQALRALESISGLDTGTTYTNGVYGGGDPTKFGLPANATSADVIALNKQNGLIANGDPAAIKAGLASSNPWLKANAEREAAKHPELLQAGAVGRLAGNATAANPAEQERLLAGQAAGTVPSGPSLPMLAPSPGEQPQATPPVVPPPVPQLPTPAPVEGAVVKPNILTTLTGGQNTTGGLPVPAPSGAQPPTASGMGNVAQTAVTPENALTNAMLSRAPGADRFKIAQDQYKAAEEASAPQYEADLRQAMRKAAAGGALGSGMLQTSIGDIAQNRDIFNRANRTNLLSEALKGTIADQFGDVGIAQQQQGFQQGQQQQAFGNEVTRAGLEEALTSGSFQRALQQLTAGSGGNPADTALLLSQIFGGQASEAGSSLAQLLAGLGQKSTAGGTGGGSAPSTSNLLSTLLQYAPTLFGSGRPAAGLPTGQAIGGGTGPTSPFAFTG